MFTESSQKAYNYGQMGTDSLQELAEIGGNVKI